MVSRLHGLRGAGKFSQIVFPVFGTGYLAVIRFIRLLDFLADFVLFSGDRFFLNFLQKGIFQQLTLYRFHQLQTGELQQPDSLLQLGGHDKLLR